MDFSVEEMNLMCIFDTSAREANIAEITAAMPYFDDPEMHDIAESAIKKLAKMSDDDFSEIILIADY